MTGRAKRSLPLLLAVLFAVAALATRSGAAGILGRIVEEEDRYYLPPASWLRAFCVGYNEAAADLVWVTTIVYFGERARFGSKSAGKTGPGEGAGASQFTVNYLSVVTSLDPRFRGAYEDGSRLTMYHRGRITRQAVEMAIDLLRKGVTVFPNDGALNFSLGFLLYYELEPFLKDDPRGLKRAKEEGTAFIVRSSTMPGVPSYVALTSSTLLRREGLDDLVVEHLRAMLVKETDPSIRASLELQLRRELGKSAERDIARTARLERRWRREMPFVPFDLFLALEPQIPWSPMGVADPSSIDLE